MRTALVAALVLTVAGAVAAAPSFFGPTGLIVMPTADAMGLGQANAFVSYLDWGADDELVYGANAGIGFGVELGVAQVDDSNVSGSETILNAKWNFLKETLVTPGVAVGAINLTGNDDFSGSIATADEGKIDPYIVVSKKVDMPSTTYSVAAHLGYVGGNIDEVMIGGSLQITPDLSIAADFIDGYSDFSIGARYRPFDRMLVGVGSIDGNLLLDASFSFGFE